MLDIALCFEASEDGLDEESSSQDFLFIYGHENISHISPDTGEQLKTFLV
jgi:hypothetical protein